MKVFLPLGNAASIRPSEMNAAIRGAVERYWGGLRSDSFLSITHESEDQFFLKSSQRFMVWGKILFEPLTPEKGLTLSREYDELSRSFAQPLRACIFFSQQAQDFQPQGFPAETSFFQYTLIESKGEKAMLIKPVSFTRTEQTLPAALKMGKSALSEDRAFKQPQLTQNELSELISLSLDLKRA